MNATDTNLFDHEAEAVVVGAILVRACEPDFSVFMADIQDAVSAEDFHRPGPRAVYEAITRVYARGDAIEIAAVKSELQDAGTLELVGGVAGLVDLAAAVPSGGLTALQHAARVRGLASLRRLTQATTDIAADAARNPGDASEVIDRAESRIFAISRQTERQRPRAVGDGLAALVDRLEAGEPAAVGLDTGLPSLDATTGGFKPGQLIVGGGPPSVGKTALGTGVAIHAAVIRRRGVHFLSLEMTTAELQRRALSALSGVSMHRMDRPDALSAAAIRNLRDAVDTLADAPLYLDECAGLTAASLRSRVRREAARHDIGLVVIDYLQLIAGSHSGNSNRNNEIAEISRAVKVLASELEIPVLLLSQLNRTSRGESRKPQLHDLRDSGAIEQDADIVILLHSEDYAHRGESGHTFTGETDLIVAKNRNGPTGVARVVFNPERAAFADMEVAR
ncbi:MAG: replicative DNA helicase [Planctomycetes bacterium]|nr:replicative DNA helicase [Planctomycetota bacterium]